ncbi:hypothetical protein Y032_0006g2850 [Ancylostoma ceylanicum]|uniref:Uncharacterized protein n=1 Tax=Ancylostoma ceylanicum TaxID=53326 RepID=A0A016VQ99_9BILA|nr:hypothetical protein Y032_0006g2850 [Ancylostoma ceylanicum]
MLSIRLIFVRIILWRLNTMRNYQAPGLSSASYTTHVILPTSHPLLRVLSSFVSEHTAPSSYMFMLIVINGSLTANKE